MPPKKPTVKKVAQPPRIELKKTDVDNVVKSATDMVAKKMGTPANALPPSIKTAINQAANTALNARLQTIVQRDVDAAVKETVLAGVKPIEMLDARMDAARIGIGHITNDAKVAKILGDTATLLFKKYTALVAAGFSNDQAFELLRAEVAGRSSRNR